MKKRALDDTSEESIKAFLKAKKRQSKKRNRKDADQDDEMACHHLLRLSVADPDTSDDEDAMLARLDELMS